MKTTMKKTAAYLLAMLLIFQMLPSLADGTESNTVHPITDYRDKLDITAVTKTLTVGMQITLAVNENYEKVAWSSQNENIATVDQNGVVTGISEGKAKITATEDGHSDSITLLVVAATAPAEPDNTPSDNGTPEDEPETPREEMIIFINGAKQRLPYIGSEYVNEYSATSNRADFSADKLHLTEEGATHLAHAVNGGVAYDELTEADFYYDSDETVTLVITNGWLQIRPATLNIYVNNATKKEGEPDPVFSADLDGLKGNDTAESIGIQYSVTEDNKIVPNVATDDMIGNYRVGTVYAGKLTIQTKVVSPLYNIAQIGSTYYRLRKTTIKTEKTIDEYVADLTKDGNGKTVPPAEYSADDYDFENEIITTKDNKRYAYISHIDEPDLGVDGFYSVTPKAGEELTAVRHKIGAVGNWLIPEADRYTDNNYTNSFHRNYTITLINQASFTTQDIYSLISINGSTSYHRLKKGTFLTSRKMETVSVSTVLKPEEYKLTPYDFTNIVITIDGVDYHYYAEAPEDEYVNYYTVEFEKVIKEKRFNGDEKWYKNDAGYLDNSKSDYEGLPNQTPSYHANYKATTHKGKERKRSVTISSDWPAEKVAYPGARITLTAHPVGFGENVKYQWQRSTNRENWENIPGETGKTFTYTLDNSTAQYFWRVVADE